jgi:hypothetical protein
VIVEVGLHCERKEDYPENLLRRSRFEVAAEFLKQLRDKLS